jgi:hypothetical protein
MSYQQALKKAGLPLIRSSIQSTESVFLYIYFNLEVYQLLHKNDLRLHSSIKYIKMVKLQSWMVIL